MLSGDDGEWLGEHVAFYGILRDGYEIFLFLLALALAAIDPELSI